MARLTKHGKLGMGILRIMVEMGRGQPDSVEATLDLAPADLALLGTTHLTGPPCLLFACFGPFIPVMRIALFVPRHRCVAFPSFLLVYTIFLCGMVLSFGDWYEGASIAGNAMREIDPLLGGTQTWKVSHWRFIRGVARARSPRYLVLRQKYLKTKPGRP